MKVNGVKQPSKRVQNEKQVRAFLLARAMEIPPMYEDHPCSKPMTGREMVEAGLTKGWTKEQLADLDRSAVYMVPGTITKPVDHFKRMWKLAKTKGAQAAVAYYDQAMRACLERPDNYKVGNIQTEVERAFV